MKTIGWLFAGIAIFVLPVTLVYWFGFTQHDPAGTTALALTFGLGLLIGSYVLFTRRRLGPGPDDDPDADIADGAGEVGFFSPHSWWPLAMAGTGACVFAGIAFGWWMVYTAAPLFVLSVVGFVFEYYRGDSAKY